MHYLLGFLSFCFIALTGSVRAAETHIPDWQLGFQEAVTPVKEMMYYFHYEVLIIITAITVFVIGLIFWLIVRYNAKAQKEPSKTTHNTLLEIIWTTIPILILIMISIPSFRLLYYMDKSPDQYQNLVVIDGEALADGEPIDATVRIDGEKVENAEIIREGKILVDGEIRVGTRVVERTDANTVFPELTLKVVGYQWYWSYEYPDQEIPLYESRMLQDDQLTPEKPYRLLEVDNRVVVPINTNVRVQITAADVIHSWAMPAFGIKTDAVPGRLNETWMRITKPGTYYGQCSELCGALHGFMPIAVEAVSQEEFDAWVEETKAALAANQPVPSVNEIRKELALTETKGK